MRKLSKFTRLAREVLAVALLAVKLVEAVWELVSKAVNWTGSCFAILSGPGRAKGNSYLRRSAIRTVAAIR